MTKRVFRTMQDARRALALDTGFDPFVSGGWGRCTKQKLADAGYVVDPAEVRKRQDEAAARELAGKCRECGADAMTEIFCASHNIGNCGRSMKTPHPSFADNLRLAMERAEVSQTELGQAIGAGPKHIWNYLNGKREPSLHTLEQIARVLKTTPGKLLQK